MSTCTVESAALVILESGAPLVALVDMLAIWEDPNELETIAPSWVRRHWFSELCETLVGQEVVKCEDCASYHWADDSNDVGGSTLYRWVCGSCFDDYSICESCSNYAYSDDSTYLDNFGVVCERCLGQFYYCENCEEYRDGGSCEYCEDNSCQCEAPHKRFTLFGLREDERSTVEVPTGTVDERGIALITDLLSYLPDVGRVHATKAVNATGPAWQGRRGNLTRRLSREVWQLCGVKLAPATLSEVGNIARQHTSNASTRDLAFTRDLNLPAEDFCNEESCWWRSYAASRCAFKNWGGIALRTFTGDRPTGRALVQPLGADMLPTHDAERATAYLVYNAYEDLTGYEAARLVAGMAGLTYRRVAITLDAIGTKDCQYVNGGTGFLVASEDVCRETDSYCHADDAHATADAARVSVPHHL